MLQYFLVGRNTQGSKVSNNEYLAQTIVITSYIEIQRPPCIGTWTLRDTEVLLSATFRVIPFAAQHAGRIDVSLWDEYGSYMQLCRVRPELGFQCTWEFPKIRG